MFVAYVLALLRVFPAHAERLGRAFDQVADELLEDAPGFWKKHRSKVAILVVSALTSGLVSYLGERLNGFM